MGVLAKFNHVCKLDVATSCIYLKDRNQVPLARLGPHEFWGGNSIVHLENHTRAVSYENYVFAK